MPSARQASQSTEKLHSTGTPCATIWMLSTSPQRGVEGCSEEQKGRVRLAAWRCESSRLGTHGPFPSSSPNPPFLMVMMNVYTIPYVHLVYTYRYTRPLWSGLADCCFWTEQITTYHDVQLTALKDSTFSVFAMMKQMNHPSLLALWRIP